jgi:hypothetical protein
MATLIPSPSAPRAEVLVHAVVDGDSACPSCSAVLLGDYCHACGERRHHPERLSFRHFFRDLAGDVFDLDSRALRSLRLLVARPGFLTLEQLQGRRRPYIGALKMYLVVFAVTLFATSFMPDGASTGTQSKDGVSRLYLRVVHVLAVRRHATDAAMKKTLEQVTAQHVSWLSLLIPLIFATFLYAMFGRRRRMFGEHLMFATHFATVNFLVGLVIIPLQLVVMRVNPSLGVATSALALIPLMIWAVVAVKRVYGTGWPGAVGSALALFLALSVAQLATAMLAVCTASLAILWGV